MAMYSSGSGAATGGAKRAAEQMQHDSYGDSTFAHYFRGLSYSILRPNTSDSGEVPLVPVASRSASQSAGFLMMREASNPRGRSVVSRPSKSKSVQRGFSRQASTARSSSGRSIPRAKKRRRSASARRSRSRLRSADAHASAIVVLCENRAREVGIASIDLNRLGALQIWQFADTQNYVHTLGLLYMMEPVEILMPATADGSLLFTKVQQAWGETLNARRLSVSFPGPLLALRTRQPHHTTAAIDTDDTSLRTMKRSAFNGDEGTKRLARLSAHASKTASESKGKYTGVAAANALLQYTEHVYQLVFEPESLNVVVESGQGRMVIDFDTLVALEMFVNKDTGSQTDSLFNVCNFCYTKLGQRYLRAQLMAPPTDLAVIEARQDAVEELVNEPERGHLLRTRLEQLNSFDVDRLVGHLSHRPKTTSIDTCARSINNLLQLKDLLTAIVGFADSPDGFTSPMLAAVSKQLGSPHYRSMVACIEQYLNPDAEWKKKVFDRYLEELFAVKSGFDSTLDAMRQLFMQNLEQLYAAVGRYQEEWEIPGLKHEHNKKRGHYLQIPAYNAQTGLPSDAIECERLRDGRVNCTTVELVTLNRYLQHNVGSIYECTDEIVVRIRAELRLHVGQLCVLGEAIGLIDFLFSLSCMPLSDSSSAYSKPTLVEVPSESMPSHGHGSRSASRGESSDSRPSAAMDDVDGSVGGRDKSPTSTSSASDTNGSTAPQEADDGTSIILRQARHPCIERASSDGFVPNDFRSDSDGKCISIIRGANGTGKSTYLRTIAVNVILAQIGAFCPCEAMRLTPFKRLATKLGDSDNLTEGVSSFYGEMQKAAYILGHADQHCLVLIDELGKSTSHADAAGIGVGVLEYLAEHRCHAVFATHNEQIAKELSQEAQTSVAMVTMTMDSSGGNLRCLFRAATGSDASTEIASRYGIHAARRAGLPSSLIADATRIFAILDEGYDEKGSSQAAEQATAGAGAVSAGVMSGQLVTSQLDGSQDPAPGQLPHPGIQAQGKASIGSGAVAASAYNSSTGHEQDGVARNSGSKRHASSGAVHQTGGAHGYYAASEDSGAAMASSSSSAASSSDGAMGKAVQWPSLVGGILASGDRGALEDTRVAYCTPEAEDEDGFMGL